MLKNYKLEEYWKLYEELPEKVRSLFWEEDIENRIKRIIERFELSSFQQRKFIRIVAHLFLGVLPPSHLLKAVEEDVSLKKDNNERLTSEIIRFVVYPTQYLLRKIYADEEFEKIGVKKFYEKKEKGFSEFNDTYREPIE